MWTNAASPLSSVKNEDMKMEKLLSISFALRQDKTMMCRKVHVGWRGSKTKYILISFPCVSSEKNHFSLIMSFIFMSDQGAGTSGSKLELDTQPNLTL